MQRLSDSKQKWLLAPQPKPCVTIYVDFLDVHEAVRTYSSLLQEAQRLIEESQLVAVPDAFMRPLLDFMSAFLKLEGLEGVAVFRSRSMAGYIPLYSKTRSEMIVADSFHVEPILSLLQESHKYQVLTLGERSAQLFLATQTSLERFETFTLEDEPARAQEPEWSHVMHGLWRLKLPAGATETRREQFCRLLQDKIKAGIEHSGRPLILIAQAELIQAYKRINTYPATIEREIAHDPDAISDLGLHDEIEAPLREIASREDFNLVSEYLDRYEERDATDSIEQISQLVFRGQIQTLLIERNRKLWGMFDRNTGKLETHDSQLDARDGDVLDDFSKMVVSSGGNVVVLDSHFMPSASPVAAIFKRAQAA